MAVEKRVTVYVRKRATKIADMLLSSKLITVRGIAESLKIPPTTVHRDLHLMQYIDNEKYIKILDKLNINDKEKSARGGEATRLKFNSKTP